MTRLLARMVDANLNRVREGLRVVEDILRFGQRHVALSAKASRLRHAVTRAGALLAPATGLLIARDAAGDPGRGRWRAGRRARLADLLQANLRRAQEGARVLEEVGRYAGRAAAVRRLQAVRYALYDLERRTPVGGGR